MTRARVERVEPDPDTAQQLLAQAREHLGSATAQGVDPQAGYGLCYQAALKAMVALLLSGGRRVTAGAGSHIVIIREALDELELSRATVNGIDHMRQARHRVFYDVLEITELEREGGLRDAATVIDAVGSRLSKR
jgi:uncharacterized protein (UPF0332 family)